MKRHPGVAMAVLFVAGAAFGQFAQQGEKLVGSGASGLANQGAVAISADGNTAIVGGPDDHNASGGAVWVFTRSSGVWSQQGGKLLGTGATAGGDLGRSVAVSADGNTAVAGNWADNSNKGAVWVFTRSGGFWSQQGGKLTASDATANAHFGWTVAVSADGNTALVGGNNDNASAGAAWIFTRSNSVWSQQGHKLVGTGAVGAAKQGISVAISGDGTTAIVGGYNDNAGVGAAWVFRRNGNLWSQQGNKFSASDGAGKAGLGGTVALSADGSTAIVGGLDDNSNVGAAWIFTRSGGVWSQQGSKLVGAGAVGNATQGTSVSISADGDTAASGADQDNSAAGAVWVFRRCGESWSQLGDKLVGTGEDGAAALGASVAISGDGRTILAGGPNDARIGGFAAGATWVFAFDSSATPFGVIPICAPPPVTVGPDARPRAR